MQGPKPAERLAKGEPEGTQYDFEEKINFAVFPSLQVSGKVYGFEDRADEFEEM